jgi:hypothetical protein
MTQERIDLTQFEEMDVTSMPIWYSKIPDLLAELKRMYEGVDALIAELEIINNRETKNEVDGNLIVDYLKRL